MSRIFLSTLGTGNYVKCHYLIGHNFTSKPVTYVQEAIIDYLCPEWTEQDRIVIICTEEARKKHWREGEQSYLHDLLRKRGYRSPVSALDIPTGKSEQEIMEIFSRVIDVFQDGDEVFLDITHSFRSIPLLMIVILNYAKVVKNTTVSQIFYGALEAIGTPQEVSSLPEEQRKVPVFDLTAYDSLLEWARAVDVFRRAGYAGDLSRLINKNLGLLFKDKPKSDQRSHLEKFSRLKNALENLSNNLTAARGPYLEDFQPISDVIDQIEKLNIIPPLTPLFDMLKDSIRGFEAEDFMERTFHAARWCLEHFMIPQAYVFIREGIITALCQCANHDEYDEDIRERFWSILLKVVAEGKPYDKWSDTLKLRGKEAKHIIAKGGETFEALAKAFERVRKYRNDLLHGGWKKDKSSAHTLMAEIKSCLDDLSGAWNSYYEYMNRCSRKAFIILSHELTETQREELTSEWAVGEIVLIPKELLEMWQNLPPSQESIEQNIAPILAWLQEKARPGDIVVVQGEHGATTIVAIEAHSMGLFPVYATTERILEERPLPDGTVRQERIFRHARFRRFFPETGQKILKTADEIPS
jgi:CRISPR-associated Csx2 family protein